MAGQIVTAHLQLGPVPTIDPSGIQYSYNGMVTVKSTSGVVDNPNVPLTAGGDCDTGPYCNIHGTPWSSVVYDLGNVQAIWELWARWKHIGDNHVRFSLDNVHWIPAYYNRISFVVGACATEKVFHTIFSYPTAPPPPPVFARYIEFEAEGLVLIGDYTHLAYFWWVGIGGIYTDNVEFGPVTPSAICTNGVRNG